MFSNRRQDGCSHTEPEALKFPVAEIPYSFQLDHVSTLFAKVSFGVHFQVHAAIRSNFKQFYRACQMSGSGWLRITISGILYLFGRGNLYFSVGLVN